MLPSASRKWVDDADAFNDLSVIHVFGQQRFARAASAVLIISESQKES